MPICYIFEIVNVYYWAEIDVECLTLHYTIVVGIDFSESYPNCVPERNLLTFPEENGSLSSVTQLLAHEIQLSIIRQINKKSV